MELVEVERHMEEAVVGVVISIHCHYFNLGHYQASPYLSSEKSVVQLFGLRLAEINSKPKFGKRNPLAK